jgi:PLP dependent protein
MSVELNLAKIKQNLPPHVTLVAVSKLNPVEKAAQAYAAGQRVFAENRVQELLEKYQALPKDIAWHLIGHLQSNKVKPIAPFIAIIESVDSAKLLAEINLEAGKHNRKIAVLFQMKIAQEESKYGLTEAELEALISAYQNGEYPNVVLKGLMGMASFSDDEAQVAAEFKLLKSKFDHYNGQGLGLEVLSMGMSNDYQLAIACGANSVRIGSAIFKD